MVGIAHGIHIAYEWAKVRSLFHERTTAVLVSPNAQHRLLPSGPGIIIRQIYAQASGWTRSTGISSTCACTEWPAAHILRGAKYRDFLHGTSGCAIWAAFVTRRCGRVAVDSSNVFLVIGDSGRTPWTGRDRLRHRRLHSQPLRNAKVAKSANHKYASFVQRSAASHACGGLPRTAPLQL